MSTVEPFVDVEAAAAFLGVKVSYLYEKVRLGKVPSYKVGAFRRFKLSELDAWARGGKNGDLLPPQQEAASKSA